MSNWNVLLEVQDCDTKIKQLDFKLDNLPELAERAAALTERGAMETQMALHQGAADELVAQQGAIEADVATSVERRKVLDASLYDGTVVGHKDLEAIQTEIAAHRTSESGLEEKILELMELIEPVEEQIGQYLEQIQGIDEQLQHIDERLIVAQAEVGAVRDQVAAARTAAREQVPADLLAEYDQLAQHLPGPAVARLEGRKCTGCHIDIPSAQVDEMMRQPVDAIVTCPECMCMLVRP